MGTSNVTDIKNEIFCNKFTEITLENQEIETILNVRAWEIITIVPI